MSNEEIWYADRANLRQLKKAHPAYSITQLMQATGRSRSWVKKWKKRLVAAPPDDELVLWSRPSVRKTPSRPVDPLLVERILYYRDQPPANLRRTPGPKTLLYFLKKDEPLAQKGLKVPNSTSFIWKILVQNGRIVHTLPHQHQPLERPEPYTSWQLDFKDAVRKALSIGHC